MIAAVKEKVFDIIFDSLKEKIVVAREKKELRIFPPDESGGIPLLKASNNTKDERSRFPFSLPVLC